jgi:hypothetical protein
MTNDSQSGDRPADINRRGFLTRVAGTALVVGAASPTLDLLAAFPEPAATPGSVFRPGFAESDAALFAEARKHFLIPKGVTYCNTGTLGASPREVVDALVNGTRALETRLAAWPYTQPEGEPLTGYEPSLELRTAVGRVRQREAGRDGDHAERDDEHELPRERSRSRAGRRSADDRSGTRRLHLAVAAQGQAIRNRRERAAPRRRDKGWPDGVVKLFADAMTPKTKVVMFSQVVSGLGTRMPTRELCAMIRDRGALALVDGAQAVGQMQVDVKALGCDAYVASPHKWMMAPKGTGFLYIRRDIQDRFWTTLASSHWDDHESGAFRFMQYGTGAVPVHEGLIAALKFIDKIGIARIERWDAMLTKRLRDGLSRIPTAHLSSPADPRLASAITTFRVEGVKARALQEALWARHIRVRPQNDARGVRLSAHIYMSPSDVDAVLDVASKVRPA